MKKTHLYKLIQGKFKPSDSINILYALFDSKIKFHQLESFRIQERNSGNVEHHEKRIAELKASYKEVKELISKASQEDMQLDINCDINITLCKK